MSEVKRSDVVIACILAALAALVASSSTAAGLLLLFFLGGIYLALRLTRGRRISTRALVVALAFVIPIFMAVLANWV